MYNLKLIEMLTQRIAVYMHFSKGSSEKGKESAKSKWIISEVADRGTAKRIQLKGDGQGLESGGSNTGFFSGFF